MYTFWLNKSINILIMHEERENVFLELISKWLICTIKMFAII